MGDLRLDEQLDVYLADAHSIEEQALAQLRLAPASAGAPDLAAIYHTHLAETEDHERLIKARMAERGAQPSKLKDAVMAAGGVGFVWFARSQPDTPGKLAAHAYSYEHLEIGAYELLLRVAERAGDSETSRTARQICEQERAMARRLEEAFDRTVEASLRKEPAEALDSYLADAHALEGQSIQLLVQGEKVAGDPQLAHIYAEHLEESRDHQQVLGQRLDGRGARSSRLKDAALRLGALNWGAFFAAQPDTPGKLAVFSYAVEHLEIAGYEQLKRVAEAAGDVATAQVAASNLEQERTAASRIASHFDRALDAALEARGVA